MYRVRDLVNGFLVIKLKLLDKNCLLECLVDICEIESFGQRVIENLQLLLVIRLGIFINSCISINMY